jgi:hypothetical protein
MGNDTLYPPANQSTLFYASLDSIASNQYPSAITNIEKDALFMAYPNPAQNEISIDFAKGEKGVLQLYNAIGQTLQTITINTQHAKLNTSTYRNGLYFISFKNEGTSITKKIIVQH